MRTYRLKGWIEREGTPECQDGYTHRQMVQTHLDCAEKWADKAIALAASRRILQCSEPIADLRAEVHVLCHCARNHAALASMHRRAADREECDALPATMPWGSAYHGCLDCGGFIN